jgi:hypothetical protein
MSQHGEPYRPRRASPLLECAAAHHGRLLGAPARVPPGEELFASESDDPESNDQGALCTSS